MQGPQAGVVLRTLATRGRKREVPRRKAWGDGAKRKVRRTMPLANTALTMKNEGATLPRCGEGCSEAESCGLALRTYTGAGVRGEWEGTHQTTTEAGSCESAPVLCAPGSTATAATSSRTPPTAHEPGPYQARADAPRIAASGPYQARADAPRIAASDSLREE